VDSLYLPCGWPQGVCTGSAGVGEDPDPDILEAAEQEAAFILWTLTGQRFGQCEVQVSLAPRCRCARRCRCGRCVLYLPGYAGEVQEVLIDGAVDTDWTQRGNQLIKPTGWNSSDISVTYLRGRPVPPGGERSVRLLATEIFKSWCPNGNCAPPANLTERNRRGDRQVFDPAKDKATGLPYVDSWVNAVNRVGATPSVWSPDTDKWVYDSGPTPA
jgi:hypothetical protein